MKYQKSRPRILLDVGRGGGEKDRWGSPKSLYQLNMTSNKQVCVRIAPEWLHDNASACVSVCCECVKFECKSVWEESYGRNVCNDDGRRCVQSNRGVLLSCRASVSPCSPLNTKSARPNSSPSACVFVSYAPTRMSVLWEQQGTKRDEGAVSNIRTF